MAESILSSISGSLDKHNLAGIAHGLGESEQSISRGLQGSIAAILAGLAGKSEDPGSLRKLMDLAPNTSGDVTWSQAVNSASQPNSPLITSGKSILSALFGTGESDMTGALGRSSGLRHGVMSNLMAMAAPVVMSFLGRRMRDEGMSITGLGSLLQRERSNIQSALPTGVSDMFGTRAATAAAGSSPVIAQTVQKEGHAGRWLLALGLGALALGLLWHFTRPQRLTTGMASRMGELGDYVKRTLPGNVNLNVPSRGVESRLLTFIQNPNVPVDDKTWFSFDRLVFDTGTANLRPESHEQLSNIAAIMKAYPNVHLMAGGFTDNVGDPGQNLQLSRDRANRVVDDLVNMGVSRDRLTAEGYGEQYPIADNSTEAGREQNRRVALRVTQK